MPSSDTTSNAAEIQASVLRRLSGVARIELAFEMSMTARALARARIESERPAWNASEIDREVLRLMFAPADLPVALR